MVLSRLFQEALLDNNYCLATFVVVVQISFDDLFLG